MKKRVLLLDDDESIRFNFRDMVEGRDDVELYDTGDLKEAKKILKEKKVDLFISDWNLDPKASRGGPYAEAAISEAAQRGIQTIIRTETDDFTGRLSALMAKYRGNIIIKESKITEEGIIRGLPRERLG